MFELYPYQQKIVNDVRQSFRDEYVSPIVISPTGSGKTLMFAYIALGAIRKNNRVLILVHRREILQQTLEKLFSLGVQSGQIISGRPMTRDKIQVAMVGTLIHRLKYFDPKHFDLIITDECHHATAQTWIKIYTHFKNIRRIGFTATPERADGTGLIDIADCMIEGPSISELVKNDYLSYPIIYRPQEEVNNNYHIKRGDFDRDEQSSVMSRKKIVGDVIEHYKKYLDHMPTVCFCVSIEHSNLMAEAFRNAGYKAQSVWGNMPDNDRKKYISGLGNGAIEIICSCDVVSEGLDLPVIAGAILLRKTTSLGLYLQQTGRALRKSPGKNNTIILDHANNYSIHGHVLADRDWSLDHGKRDHKKDKAPKITSCPKCYGVWPGEPKKCPSCGFIFADNPNINNQQRKLPKQIEGELIAALPEGVNPEQIKSLSDFAVRIQSMSPAQRQKAMLAKCYELQDKNQIKALSKAIGYKDSWTGFVWKNILKNR